MFKAGSKGFIENKKKLVLKESSLIKKRAVISVDLWENTFQAAFEKGFP